MIRQGAVAVQTGGRTICAHTPDNSGKADEPAAERPARIFALASGRQA